MICSSNMSSLQLCLTASKKLLIKLYLQDLKGEIVFSLPKIEKRRYNLHYNNCKVTSTEEGNRK